jgi:hypothetical protein
MIVCSARTAGKEKTENLSWVADLRRPLASPWALCLLRISGHDAAI